MGNSFDFEIKANDQASGVIARIDEAVKKLQPQLDKTTEGLHLGGDNSLSQLSKVNEQFDSLSKLACDNVQSIGDIVPPLKMVGELGSKYAGILGKIGVAGAVASGVGGTVMVVARGLDRAANSAYRLDVSAKNAGMRVDDFSRLASVMRILGADADSANQSVERMYKTFNDALQGRNDGVLATLNQIGVKIARNADGTANVMETVEAIASKYPQLSPQNQKTLADNAAFDDNDLMLFRKGAELKILLTKADKFGLTVDPALNDQLVGVNEQLNELKARIDGFRETQEMKFFSWLGGDSESTASKAIKEFQKYEKDGEGNFYHGDKQQDILHRARRDEGFKDSLTFTEGIELALGRPGSALQDKLNRKYSTSWSVQQFMDDIQKISTPPAGVINPIDRVLKNTPEQKHLSMLEAKHELPSGILDNVWNAESSRGKNLLSPVGAQGPFQFMPATGRDYGLNSYGDRMDFHKSSGAAASYLSDLLKMFDGDVNKALAAYNWGPGRVRDYGLGRAPKETRDYLHKTMTGLPSYFYQQEGDLEIDSSVNQNTPSIYGYQSYQGKGDVADASKELISALSTLNQTLQDGPMQVEISMIDSKTGERRTLSSGSGGRITMPMSFP
ncbi:lytic transglycosylase domain-containing protein [Pectobacterium polaris]|uniref:lytic transglycosylase domain-containing protein n=1 Tax=Pectobacterium polaris TaxID=2042057 RepID=UPI000EA07D2B|nr:lytic transglycosylase domain-containing protein [Pectobacterium polaris]MDE8753870.1 lytic transglycosylase domain-containing protein [Pectobacterium polaris]RJL20055.1 lytic transglycosylase domain-containing protein [Pectobacterium polaris]